MSCHVDLALTDFRPQLSAVLVRACLCGLPTGDLAISTGGARQAGIVVLRLAFDALADHYEKSKRVGQSVVNAGEVTAFKK